MTNLLTFHDSFYAEARGSASVALTQASATERIANNRLVDDVDGSIILTSSISSLGIEPSYAPDTSYGPEGRIGLSLPSDVSDHYP